MHRFALAIVAVCYLSAAGAQAADSGSGEFAVTGEAPPTCAFTAVPGELTADNMSLQPGVGASKILIDNLTDQESARLNRASITFEVAGVCNRAHYLSVMTTHGGLTPESAQTALRGDFVSHVNYQAQVGWGGTTVVLTTDAVPGKKTPISQVGGANQGPLSISIVIDGANNDMNKPVSSGKYTDVLTIQIGTPL